jgi:DNA segregation ATPase FtsK/SpoIIIE-like protein
MRRARETSEDPLLPEARQWVDRLRAHGTTKLLYPVSNLQREFRLGYARACALADRLAQRGEWTVAYDEGGTRYARIHRMA